MSLTSLLAILGSVVVTALAQLCMKLASQRFKGQTTSDLIAGSLFQQMLHPLSLLAVLAYGVSLILWFLALRDVPFSVAYPFSGPTLALVAIIGIAVLGESASFSKLVGVGLIVAGVAMVARS